MQQIHPSSDQSNNPFDAEQLAHLHGIATPAGRMVLRLLPKLRVGTLDVQFPDGSSARFGKGEQPLAGISLKDWSVCDAALKSGDIGFAETYIAGQWTTPHLAQLLDFLIANRTALEAVFYGTWWGTMLYRLKHLFKRNTKVQARKNIAEHYDLGNSFYRLWLDETMTYSSALFAREGSSQVQQDLAQAQHAKYARVLGELKLQPGQCVLEIGCGWGGFAQAAIEQSQVRVTGLTLSSEQLAFATERLARAEFGGMAQFKLQDYREEAARYDGIASIEMFEAVGEQYWQSYFDCIKRNLKPGGFACIQTITIADELFERYRKSTDFIQQYIFPGGMLPSPSVFRAQAVRAGLKVTNEIAFGQDYAETLKRWRETFMARLAEVRALGYDEPFIRTWEFYLAYCEAAFARDNTNVYQFTLQS
jgi:cyclopropane-fatty-acyl-phospholipid synthase